MSKKPNFNCVLNLREDCDSRVKSVNHSQL